MFSRFVIFMTARPERAVIQSRADHGGAVYGRCESASQKVSAMGNGGTGTKRRCHVDHFGQFLLSNAGI